MTFPKYDFGILPQTHPYQSSSVKRYRKKKQQKNKNKQTNKQTKTNNGKKKKKTLQKWGWGMDGRALESSSIAVVSEGELEL